MFLLSKNLSQRVKNDHLHYEACRINSIMIKKGKKSWFDDVGSSQWEKMVKKWWTCSKKVLFLFFALEVNTVFALVPNYNVCAGKKLSTSGPFCLRWPTFGSRGKYMCMWAVWLEPQELSRVLTVYDYKVTIIQEKFQTPVIKTRLHLYTCTHASQTTTSIGKQKEMSETCEKQWRETQ